MKDSLWLTLNGASLSTSLRPLSIITAKVICDRPLPSNFRPSRFGLGHIPECLISCVDVTLGESVYPFYYFFLWSLGVVLKRNWPIPICDPQARMFNTENPSLWGVFAPLPPSCAMGQRVRTKKKRRRRMSTTITSTAARVIPGANSILALACPRKLGELVNYSWPHLSKRQRSSETVDGGRTLGGIGPRVIAFCSLLTKRWCFVVSCFPRGLWP